MMTIQQNTVTRYSTGRGTRRLQILHICIKKRKAFPDTVYMHRT